MAYAQDFDERFPPAHGERWPVGYDNWVAWLSYTTQATNPPQVVPGLLNSYLKSREIQKCPGSPDGAELSYMFSDFAAGSNGWGYVVGGGGVASAPALPNPPTLADFSAPASTVLIAESNGLIDVGHAPTRFGVGHCAWSVNYPLDAMFYSSGELIQSAQTVLTTDDPNNRANRHNGSGNYLMADGHARLIPVGWTSDTDITVRRTTGVYYPPNGRSGPTHGANEPDPAGDMTTTTPASGRVSYRATFQIN